MLVVSFGLSACTWLNSNRSGEGVAPATLPAIVMPTEIVPTYSLPVAPSDTPTEISVKTDVPQIQAASGTNQVSLPLIANSDTGTPYRLQVGTPRSLANFILPEAGCNWMGVGGQAFNLSGQPVSLLVVEVGGTLAGADVFHLELTGNHPNLGASGYLITLSDRPVSSNGTLWILLYDLNGQPLTNKVYFSTKQDCAQNFTLINFVEVNPTVLPQIYFPLISK